MDQKKIDVFGRLLAVMVLLVVIAVNQTTPVLADDAAEAKKLVTQSKLTFDTFVAAKEMGAFRDLLEEAKGVFVAPQVLEGAFVFGVSGGSGVFVVKDAQTGDWIGPAFYTIGEVSFGLQAGGQASQVVMLCMTHRGVNALLSSSVKFGADVGVAAGPVGAGVAAATANVSADILAFSLSKGLYGGVSLNGAVVAVRRNWNNAYYEKQRITPRDILIRKDASNPDALPLLQDVARAAAPTSKTAGAAAKTASVSQGGSRYYRVQKGDTLSAIAHEHGTSVARLVELNDIENKRYIYPGQRLLLPSDR